MWPISVHTVNILIVFVCVLYVCLVHQQPHLQLSHLTSPLKVTSAEKMGLTYLNNKRSMLFKHTNEAISCIHRDCAVHAQEQYVCLIYPVLISLSDVIV